MTPNRTPAAVAIALLLSVTTAAAAPQPPSPETARIGKRDFLQLEAPAFSKLPLDQKLVAYHLGRAAIQLDPVFYDQMSTYGLTAKRLLGALAERPERLPEGSRKAILEFATLFFGNQGNHDETTGEKLLPRFTFEELAQAAEAARARGARLGSREQLARTLESLRAPLFDPKFEPQLSEHDPAPGVDPLTASSNNYYRGVTSKDLEGFADRNPLNSRLVKKDGKLVEEVYRAGTPDGKVPPGMYARELAATARELDAAAAAAGPQGAQQAKLLRQLARYYRTGDPKDWLETDALWIQTDAPVEFVSGFVKDFRDVRETKGSAQMLVGVRDPLVQKLVDRLRADAAYFEKRLPWDDKYKTAQPQLPGGLALQALIESGDLHPGAVGMMLPVEDATRERFGVRSLLVTSSVVAMTAARGAKVVRELAFAPGDVALFERHGATSDLFQSALHEVLGHGTGRGTEDPRPRLKDLFNVVEETRADLVAYWTVFDPKLAEAGLGDTREIGRELYRQVARGSLLPLKNYPTGDRAERPSDRGRLLVANYLIEAGGFERMERGGHWYVGVKDFDAAHAAVGRLLAELMRIKAEGDYDAAKALLDKYGTRFDPAVRDDVLARYTALDLPTFASGVYADLTLVKDRSGKVTDVAISYPRDPLAQQLAWARENGTLGF